MKTKLEIRNYIKSLFLQQDREEFIMQDKVIGEKVLKYIEKINVQNICIYESMSDEVDTKSLIIKLEQQGKHIYIPQMISDTEMILIHNNDFEIYEDDIDLFIIPGRAFGTDGKRLGRGKGYYDRFLTKRQYKRSKKLGICYDFQILEDIPTNKFDVSMNIIITYKNV